MYWNYAAGWSQQLTEYLFMKCNNWLTDAILDKKRDLLYIYLYYTFIYYMYIYTYIIDL